MFTYCALRFAYEDIDFQFEIKFKPSINQSRDAKYDTIKMSIMGYE